MGSKFKFDQEDDSTINREILGRGGNVDSFHVFEGMTGSRAKQPVGFWMCYSGEETKEIYLGQLYTYLEFLNSENPKIEIGIDWPYLPESTQSIHICRYVLLVVSYCFLSWPSRNLAGHHCGNDIWESLKGESYRNAKQSNPRSSGARVVLVLLGESQFLIKLLLCFVTCTLVHFCTEFHKVCRNSFIFQALPSLEMACSLNGCFGF